MHGDDGGARRTVEVELRGLGPLEAPLQEVLAGLGISVVRPTPAKAATVVVWAMHREGATGRVRRVRPPAEVLVLLDRPTRAEISELVGAGARAVLDVAAGPAAIGDAVLSVARGYLVLPASERHVLVQPGVVHDLDELALGWVRVLATGASMSQLAEDEGCSERAMYRRLREVYDRLGVADRAAAIALLARAKLLTQA
jgi:DNA-binding NarL/FixJ family response regulator